MDEERREQECTPVKSSTRPATMVANSRTKHRPGTHRSLKAEFISMEAPFKVVLNWILSPKMEFTARQKACITNGQSAAAHINHSAETHALCDGALRRANIRKALLICKHVKQLNTLEFKLLHLISGTTTCRYQASAATRLAQPCRDASTCRWSKAKR